MSQKPASVWFTNRSLCLSSYFLKALSRAFAGIAWLLSLIRLIGGKHAKGLEDYDSTPPEDD